MTRQRCEDCGSEIFIQESLYKVKEQVHILMDEDEDVEVIEQEPIVSKPINFDEVVCKQCGKIYYLE